MSYNNNISHTARAKNRKRGQFNSLLSSIFFEKFSSLCRRPFLSGLLCLEKNSKIS